MSIRDLFLRIFDRRTNSANNAIRLRDGDTLLASVKGDTLIGTDDLYPSYLLSFLKDGGELVIGSPCYRAELESDTPEEFLLEFPACLAVHSPGWWRHHFTKTKEADVLLSDLHPRGAEFWDDRVRFLLEAQRPPEMRASRRNMVYEMIRMLNRDADGFVSHFMLHAKKRKTMSNSEAPSL